MFGLTGFNAIPNTMPNASRQPAVPGMECPDPAAWYSDDISKLSDQWIYNLSEVQVNELMDRVSVLERDGVEIKDISRELFPLPNVGPALEDVYHQLTEGRGFVLIRGLPVLEMSTWQAGAAFFGMGTYLGRPVSQNPMGHLLGHVKNLGKDYNDPMVRGYQTAAQMNFHSDQCDYVGLMCMHPAKSGGESLIASSITVYNEMQKRRPDLADALCKEFYFTKHGEVKDGEEPFYCMPIFAFHEGYLSIRAGGAHVRKAQLLEGVPKFTEIDIEALDMFQALAKELYMPMEFEVGDIQFLHNHVMLHTRTAFEDYEEHEKKRHLMRLWLTDPDGRPTLPGFRENISGIEIDGTVHSAPLDMLEGAGAD